MIPVRVAQERNTRMLRTQLNVASAVLTSWLRSVEIDYADSAPVLTTFTAIDGLLSGFIVPAKGSTSVSFVGSSTAYVQDRSQA
jgi:hypothetical protein